MPRYARLILPEVPLHIVHRGTNRTVCFVDANDRLVYLALLRDSLQRYDCALHAYCLMTNHVHLLLTPFSASACAALMHRVAQGYAQYFNRKTGRTGALWEGRFRSSLVAAERYVLNCYRYIELNPVRAGIATDPGEYRWSSATANIGNTPGPTIMPHAAYAALGQEAYLSFLLQEVGEEELRGIREALNASLPLGGESLDASLLSDYKLRPGKRGRPPGNSHPSRIS